MRFPAFAALILFMTSCSKKETPTPAVHDVHSYGNPAQVRVRHVNLDLTILFEQRTLRGTAILTVEPIQKIAQEIILDTRALQIEETEISENGSKYRATPFHMGPPDPILGSPLRIEIAPATKYVRIRYSTSPSATA